jgi:hypothetical protein
LAFPIRKTEKIEPEVTIDVILEDRNDGEDLADKLRQIESLKVLFSKFKFFLNREVPKEALAFVIRSWFTITINKVWLKGNLFS